MTDVDPGFPLTHTQSNAGGRAQLLLPAPRRLQHAPLPQGGTHARACVHFLSFTLHYTTPHHSLIPHITHTPTTHPTKQEEREAALALVDALTLPTDRATGSALRLAPHPGIRALWQAATAKAVAKGGCAHHMLPACVVPIVFLSSPSPTVTVCRHAGIEDEEAAADKDDDDAMDVGAEAAAEGPSNNPLGRERVRAWGQGLRAAQEAEEDRDGAREEDEGLPAPVAVPFLSIKTGQAAIEGEAALPKEMRRDPELWERAKVRGVRGVDTTPTHCPLVRSCRP